MAENEVKLMKGNEVIAHAAIRYGCDGYFGYPITPQSEVMETLMELKPWETTGMVVLQAESEISSINMVYGGASTGKRVMTSSSSPGISLMSEGLSYLAGAELPCLVINCQRGGPGLGTIQPSQGDYFQACKGGGHGDFHMIVLAPNSVQEMHDHVFEAFDLAFKYRNPALILADGAIGQMMEKVVLAPQRPRKTDEELKAECLLPNMVGDLLKKGQLSVSVLHSADRWFGMTYHEDRQAVAQELTRLHENGTYPATLRN